MSRWISSLQCETCFIPASSPLLLLIPWQLPSPTTLFFSIWTTPDPIPDLMPQLPVSVLSLPHVSPSGQFRESEKGSTAPLHQGDRIRSNLILSAQLRLSFNLLSQPPGGGKKRSKALGKSEEELKVHMKVTAVRMSLTNQQYPFQLKKNQTINRCFLLYTRKGTKYLYQTFSLHNLPAPLLQQHINKALQQHQTSTTQREIAQNSKSSSAMSIAQANFSLCVLL